MRFGKTVADELEGALGDQLLGVYFVGSVALGGYVAGESDIDVIGVSRDEIGDALKVTVIAAVERAIESCPARGLEFTLYRSAVVKASPDGADFEVNVNGGLRMERVVRTDPTGQPPFWYILDRAIAYRCGVTVVGPPPAEVFGDIERPVLVRAMAESMRWHREHEPASLYSVLNAARAWRFAEDDVLGSKLDGATWAAQRWSRPEVIEAAVQLRLGRSARLDAVEVAELLDHVESLLG